MGTLNVDKLAKTSTGAAEFTLPAADGTAGQVMQTDGSGQLSIAALAADTVTATQIATDAVGVAELSATGTASGTTALFGDNAWKAVSDVSGLASVQVFTSDDTWTRPTGITKVIVEVQGAGGAGCKSQSNTTKGVGGGGGGYAKKFLDVSSISTSTITVGDGGAAQATNDTAGAAGEASSWADGTNTITGNGGPGGTFTAYGRVAGGTATGGDINMQGGSGIAGGMSETAGDSFYGQGGYMKWTGQQTDDTASGYGSGGAGSYQLTSGAGMPGIVIVTEYK